MPMTVDEVINDIDAILARSEDACVNALMPVMRATPKQDQIFICLELFHMQSYELVCNAFFIRDGKLATDHACFPGFEGQASFIPELDIYLKKIFGQTEWSEAQGHEFSVRHEKQFADWFKKIWTAAGGDSAKSPVYFCFEKEYQVQDVQTGKVMEELEAANLLGYPVTDLY